MMMLQKKLVSTQIEGVSVTCFLYYCFAWMEGSDTELL
jgi:hypothetical protein